MAWTKEDYSAAAKRWRSKNPDKARAASRAFYYDDLAAHPEKYTKDIRREKAKQWRERNPRSSLKYSFGLLPEEYAGMLAAQHGVCAICQQPEMKQRNGKVIALAVDHCHTTEKLRGLLCSKCNTGLGLFSDSQATLAQAIAYLNRYQKVVDEATPASALASKPKDE